MVKGRSWIWVGKQDFQHICVEFLWVHRTFRHHGSAVASQATATPLLPQAASTSLLPFRIFRCVNQLPFYHIQETQVTLSNSVEALHLRLEVRGKSFPGPSLLWGGWGSQHTNSFLQYSPLLSTYAFMPSRKVRRRGKPTKLQVLNSVSHLILECISSALGTSAETGTEWVQLSHLVTNIICNLYP